MQALSDQSHLKFLTSLVEGDGTNHSNYFPIDNKILENIIILYLR